MIKTSIPKLRTIRPKCFEQEPIRKHISQGLQNLFSSKDNPVVGYALVSFHKDGQSGATWHTSQIINGNALIDFPDAVRNRLKLAIEQSRK